MSPDDRKNLSRSAQPGDPSAGASGGNGGERWTFLRDAIDALQKKDARFPHRLFKPFADWANRQEQSGFLRFWFPTPQVIRAGEVGMPEERDVKLDPFFLTSIVLHLIIALLFWKVISELPPLEPPKEDEVIVTLEDLLPSEAGSPADTLAMKPEPAKPAAAPKPVARAPEPKTAAPKQTQKPKPRPIVKKPVPTPAPEPILVPKQVRQARAISQNAPITPSAPTLSQRVPEFAASAPSADVSLGAGTSAAEIDVDRGGGAGIRGPAGPIAVPGGRGKGTGLGAGQGRGDIQGSPLRSFQTDPDFQAYFKEIERRANQVWQYPAGVHGKHTVVLAFRLDAGARAYDISVKRSSNPALNKSAVNAMKRGSPFPPIPAKFRGLIGRRLVITFWPIL